MNTNQDIRSRTEWKIPPNYGWLEHKLNQKEIAYIWECIGEKNKEKCNIYLAGNINSSFPLYDKNEWFYKNTVVPLIDLYNESFTDYGANLAKIMHLTKKGEKMHLSLPYKMTSWWVNYQKENEFNPIHGHSGVYSFVILTEYCVTGTMPMYDVFQINCISKGRDASNKYSQKRIDRNASSSRI